MTAPKAGPAGALDPTGPARSTVVKIALVAIALLALSNEAPAPNPACLVTVPYHCDPKPQ